MRKTIQALLLGTITLVNFSVYAQSIPTGMAADHHVKRVVYDPNNVVLLRERYGYETHVVFSPSETVQNVSIGDSSAWQVNPVGNNLFIKPIAASVTNMTVLTNSNSYNFQLDSSNSNAVPTFKLQFIYPDGGYDASGRSNAIASFDPEKLNWKYSFTGVRDLVPSEVFDNGQFTYFKFKQDGMSHIPAIFTVDKKRHETLVNYHMQGDYAVIHNVAKQFTLRDGDDVTSIYNDYAIGDWRSIR